MHIIAGQHTPIIAGQSQWSKIGAPMQQIDIVRKKYPYTGQAHGQKDEKIKIQQQRGNPKSPAWHEKRKEKAFSGFGRTGRNSFICFFPAPLVFHHRMTQSKTERTTPVKPYERSYPLLSSKRKSAVISKSCHGTFGNMRRQRIPEQKRLTLILSL